MRLVIEDENYLLKSISDGEAILIIGAGASVSSKNSSGTRVKASKQLAALLAEEAALPYDGEDLTDVLGAIAGVISSSKLKLILEREYKNVVPSPELQKIFMFTWKRIYTWNIDDSLEACTRHFTQIRKYHNGKTDKARDFDAVAYLDVVHLHGSIGHPEHGFILSEADYAEAIKSEKHFWYQRLAQDYLTQCPIFIGTQIAEPILAAELEKARRDSGGGQSGRAFLVTPDSLSPIKTASYKAKGIVHIRATLEEFAAWLEQAFPKGISPKDVVSRKNRYPETVLDSLTADELEAAFFVRPISLSRVKEQIAVLPPSKLSTLARQFLNGFPPSWIVAASNIPADLEANASLYQALSEAIASDQRLFVITGQSGSGKSTAAMKAILKFSEEHSDVKLFEIDPGVKSMATAFRLLRRLHVGKIVVYLGDLFVYGDSFSKDLEEISGDEVTVVSTARQGEWNDRLSRHINVAPFVFPRFSRADYGPLIERIKKYVPSPAFQKKQSAEQHQMLGRKPINGLSGIPESAFA